VHENVNEKNSKNGKGVTEKRFYDLCQCKTRNTGFFLYTLRKGEMAMQRVTDNGRTIRRRQINTEDQEYDYMPPASERVRRATRNIITEETEIKKTNSYYKKRKRLSAKSIVVIMIVVSFLVLFVSHIIYNSITELSYDIKYGKDTRMYQTDYVVKRGDSPSHFIVENLHGNTIIIEFPAGDTHNAVILSGPTLVSDRIPVTIKFKDLDKDGNVDMVIQTVEDVPLKVALMNDGKGNFVAKQTLTKQEMENLLKS
jgi:hypothetical protein